MSIPAIDLAFADSFKNVPDKSKTFLAFLLASARAGHLSIHIDNGCLKPSVKEVWDINHIPDEEIIAGAIEVQDRVQQVGSRYYLQRLLKAETVCLQEWKRLQGRSVILSQELSDELTEEQKNAVRMGCEHNVFILTGGPGTGKTFTAAKFLKTYMNRLTSKEIHIAVVAPTGKAALTLQTVLSKELPEGCSIQAKTVHALLNLRGTYTSDEDTPALPYDLLIVDEASMIDVELMACLLKGIKTGAKLFLMGDPYQLPPVDGPAIFPHLLSMHDAKIALTKCLRAEAKALVDQAELIKQGGHFIDLPPYVKRLDITKDAKSILKTYLPKFHHQDAFAKFRILSPLKKGPFGTEQINQFFLESYLKEGAKAFPIMISANDYRLELFNGETGVLVMKHPKREMRFSSEDMVHFSNGRQIPALLLPAFDFCYAMTVHKSQGSEFEEVLLLLPKECSYSQNLLYTAVTRAKKKFTVYTHCD